MNASSNDRKPLTIALAGFGTVGAALYYLIRNDRYRQMNLPANLVGDRPLQIVGVYARDRSKPRTVLLDNETVTLDNASIPFVESVDEFFDRLKPDVIVEVTGNVGFASQLIRQAIDNNIHVITANKALMAAEGLALAKLAEEKDVALRMEAAVGGELPIIQTLYDMDHVKSITAILNGTCNFILDKMTCDNMSYDDALKEAQALGFAEADPSFDVSGRDAAQKLVLLAAIAFSRFVPESEVDCQGITDITPAQISAAKAEGKVYKLLCKAEKGATGFQLSVAPALVAENSAFGQVKGSGNIVELQFDNGTTQTLTGFGAGGIPTAKAVLLDLACLSGLSPQAPILPVFKQSSRRMAEAA